MEGEFSFMKEQAWDRAGTDIQCVNENVSLLCEHLCNIMCDSENS